MAGAVTKAAKKIEPGDAKFDWAELYKEEVELFEYENDGVHIALPEFQQPKEGEVFGLMLMDKSDQDILVYIMRKLIIESAEDGDAALGATFRALQKMATGIEQLLTEWPEAAGIDTGKSAP